MGKALILTEKPSVARDVVAALGGFKAMDKDAYWESDDYVCTYAVGHLLTLQEPEDINPDFKRWKLVDLPIIPSEFLTKELESQKQRLKVIRNLLVRKDVEVLINACDAAREGELIFREIVKHYKANKPIKRLWLQSMTKDAIQKGFKSLNEGKIYEGLAAAAECRSYADWLVGMNATRALTIRLKTRSQRGASWSAGRVQTPTLALLVNRELEVLSHQPIPYWRLEGVFKAADHEYPGVWFDPNFKKNDKNPEFKDDRIFDEQRASDIVKKVSGKAAVASETRKSKPRKAPLLFDLTSLQKEANRRFSWPAARTLRAAQRCYEMHKVLTYPRTSSRALPEDYREEVQKLLTRFHEEGTPYKKFAEYLLKNPRQNEKIIYNNEAVSDHFAIIPTGQIKDLEGDDFKVFDLVTRQFLAAFYPPAIYEEIERITIAEGEHFRTKPPLMLKEAGWQAVFEKEEKSDDQRAFPALKKGQEESSNVPVANQSVNQEALETKPPGRYGEASLLSLMENAGRFVEDEELSSALTKAEGLGTAATRADIIENLKSKEYVTEDLRPTVKGIRLIDILHRIKASRLTSAELTARLELHLHQVEKGERSATSFLDEIKNYTKDIVDAARDFDFDQIYPDQNPLGSCPRCQRTVFERAWFYGCTESTKRTDEKKSCNFLIWKDYKGRYIDRETVKILLEKRQTRELDGFVNQYGQSFKASLSIDANSLTVVDKPSSTPAVDLGPDHVPVEINAEPLGVCPVHGDGCFIIETQTDFVCQRRKESREKGERNNEGFLLPRSVCKRMMKREEVIHYLQNGQTEYFADFISKKGRPFSAKLVRQSNGGFVFEFPERVPKAKKTEAQPQEAK